MISTSNKKMVIISSYFKDETYGLLGPQMAATIIQDHTPYECIVIAVAREYSKSALKEALDDYFGLAKPVVGFSALSGREDLFALAKELRDQGAVTILAGPQADVDFLGEVGWRNHPHRFKGVSENFSFGIQGSAEQVIGLLNRPDGSDWSHFPGLLYADREGNTIRNHHKNWDDMYLGKVRWNNLFICGDSGLESLSIETGQVLQHIGCPHAARSTPTKIDYPVALSKGDGRGIKLEIKGCSFCDVAADKGFHRKLNPETLMSQIRCLPENQDGRKVPFELINENPLPALPGLLNETRNRGIKLSRINLTLRADYFIKGHGLLDEALQLADKINVKVLLCSVGFESFSDGILRNLNKGLGVKENIEAIRMIRQLKEKFPHRLKYSRREGANHGFIHPTPWDTKETAAEIQKNIVLYGLQNDILPPHSTPLIIHHASGLGDWIREIETREGIRFKRYGSIIGWWDEPRTGF